MDLAFGGKTALVTGAGSQVGFGKEIALLLAAEGIDAVAVTDIDLEGAEKTAAGGAGSGLQEHRRAGRHHRQRGREGHGRQGRRRLRPHRHPL